MLRKLAGLLLLLGVVGISVFIWFSRDLRETHPTLLNANKAALISVRAFYADRSATKTYLPSAGGKYYTHKTTIWANDVLVVSELQTGRKLFHLKDIDHSEWTDIPEILHVWRDSRVWAIDVTKPDEENWKDITPRGFGNWQYASVPSYETGKRWVITWDRAGSYADLWMVNMDGFGKTPIGENDGTVLSWIGDETLTPRIRLARPDTDTTRVQLSDDGVDWRTLLDASAKEVFSPLYINDKTESFVAYSSRGRDKIALVEVSTSDGLETVLVEHPEYDLGRNFSFSPFYNPVDLIVTNVDETQQFALTDNGRVFEGFLDSFENRADLEDIYQSPDGNTVSVELAPNAIGYERYFLNLEDGTSRHIGTVSFLNRHRDALVPMEKVRFTARDGLELQGFLMRPKGVEGPVPMLINIHGGPAQNHSWGYRHGRQFLVNRGYAILSVNFRGSTGYGKEFQALGYREFGRKMQHDIEDAALWAVEQGIADREALGVIGASYGGYAATMAALQRPDLFKVAIAEHAMMDVAYQSQFPPDHWGLSIQSLTKYFGDPKDEADLQIMRDYSPITHADNLQVPMLIVAGKRDGVVGIEQTERFVESAKETQFPPQTLIFEDEGHGVGRWQNRIKRARIMEDFLHEHLGGRSGGWDWIELAADYL